MPNVPCLSRCSTPSFVERTRQTMQIRTFWNVRVIIARSRKWLKNSETQQTIIKDGTQMVIAEVVVLVALLTPQLTQAVSPIVMGLGADLVTVITLRNLLSDIYRPLLMNLRLSRVITVQLLLKANVLTPRNAQNRAEIPPTLAFL